MKKSRILLSLMLIFTLVFLAGCSGNTKDTDEKDNSANNQVAEEQNEETNAPPEKVMLYIGNIGDGYDEIQVEMKPEIIYGDNFDEHLIEALEKETGWSLELAQPIEDVEGGKVVQFSDKSAFVVGPPKQQNEKCFVYDQYALAQNILDSIQKTFDMNLTDGNPQHALDIYFSLNDKTIQVENLTIPKDKPWQEARSLVFD